MGVATVTMVASLVGILGVGLGFGLARLVSARKARRSQDEHREAIHGLKIELERARAELTGQEKSAQKAEEARKTTEEAFLGQLRDAFGNLAGDALRDNSQMFLSQAAEQLKPITEQLHHLSKATSQVEGGRRAAYDDLKGQIEALAELNRMVATKSESLANALRGSSQARGRWGEMQLRNIVEIAGMAEHCDFEEQKTTADGNRPDLVVRLPGGDLIPVDSKVPLAAFLDAIETDDDVRRDQCLKQHARDVRQRVRELAGKDYASEIKGRVDFTVMFLPGDHFLAAAFRENPDIQEEAMRQRVLVVTPVTLVALLRTVGIYWRQHAMAEEARGVWEAASQFHRRVEVFQEHLKKMGRGLSSALAAFNEAVGSYEGSVIPSGRKLEKFKIADQSKKELEAPEAIDTPVRTPKETAPHV